MARPPGDLALSAAEARSGLRNAPTELCDLLVGQVLGRNAGLLELVAAPRDRPGRTAAVAWACSAAVRIFIRPARTPVSSAASPPSCAGLSIQRLSASASSK